jgi:hypothetical protein
MFHPLRGETSAKELGCFISFDAKNYTSHPPTRRAMTCESQRIGRKGSKRKEEPFLLPVTK